MGSRAMWILVISPWESGCGGWEVEVYGSEGEALGAARRRDLTKEWYVVSAEDVVALLRGEFRDGGGADVDIDTGSVGGGSGVVGSADQEVRWV